MDNMRGVCTRCGMSVEQPHICNADLEFLGTTDWKVTRHRDQLDAGEPTTLTPEEFQALLAERQAARDRQKAIVA